MKQVLIQNYNMNHYYTIEKPAYAEYKDRGSRFLAYAFPNTGQCSETEQNEVTGFDTQPGIYTSFAE